MTSKLCTAAAVFALLRKGAPNCGAPEIDGFGAVYL